MLHLRQRIGATVIGLGLGVCLASVAALGLGVDPEQCSLAAVAGVLAVASGSHLTRP